MNAIVVGGDRLGNIPAALSALGIHVTRHVDGRLAAHQRKPPLLPGNTELLILITDFLAHNVMRGYRSQAQAQGIAVVASRRSASFLMPSLQRYLASRHDDPPCRPCVPGR
jgi:hypothetical protein